MNNISFKVVKMALKSFKIIKKCIFWLIFSVFLLFFIVFCYFIFCKIILKQNYVSMFGYGGVVAVSNSMSPEIQVDDFLLIKKLNNYQVGDIVAFECDNKIITHRIAEVTDNGIITKGDQNTQNDSSISQEQILGKVVGVNNALGTIIFFVKSPIFWVVVVLIFSLFFAIKSKTPKYVDED